MTDKMRKKNPENHIVGFLINLFAKYDVEEYIKMNKAGDTSVDNITTLWTDYIHASLLYSSSSSSSSFPSSSLHISAIFRISSGQRVA